MDFNLNSLLPIPHFKKLLQLFLFQKYSICKKPNKQPPHLNFIHYKDCIFSFSTGDILTHVKASFSYSIATCHLSWNSSDGNSSLKMGFPHRLAPEYITFEKLNPAGICITETSQGSRLQHTKLEVLKNNHRGKDIQYK